MPVSTFKIKMSLYPLLHVFLRPWHHLLSTVCPTVFSQPDLSPGIVNVTLLVSGRGCLKQYATRCHERLPVSTGKGGEDSIYVTLVLLPSYLHLLDSASALVVHDSIFQELVFFFQDLFFLLHGLLTFKKFRHCCFDRWRTSSTPQSRPKLCACIKYVWKIKGFKAKW